MTCASAGLTSGDIGMKAKSIVNSMRIGTVFVLKLPPSASGEITSPFKAAGVGLSEGALCGIEGVSRTRGGKGGDIEGDAALATPS